MSTSGLYVPRSELEARLAELAREKAELKQTIKGLLKSVREVNIENRRKDEELRRLSVKGNKLSRRNPSQKNNVGSEVPGPSSRAYERAGPSSSMGGDIDFTGRKDAISILPEEVWIIVFGNLSDPKDLWNCSSTCCLFDFILHSWKSGWMLEQSLPYLYQHLPGNKLLECRLVSKSWNVGVASFLENHPSLQPAHGVGGDPRKLELVYPIKEKQLCTNNTFIFCDHLPLLGVGGTRQLPRGGPAFPGRPGLNPFLGRYVTLNLGRETGSYYVEDGVGDPWWDRLTTFLDKFGKDIWYLNVDCPDQPNEQVQLKLLQFFTSKLFQSLPNLRKLSIVRSTGYSVDNGDIDPMSLPAAPKLETLESLHILDDDPIFEALMSRYHLQIRKLHLTRWTCRRFSSLEWPNLRELQLDLEESGVRHTRSTVNASICALGWMELPQLGKLELAMPDFFQYYAWEDFLEIINRLTATTHLHTVRLSGSVAGWMFANMHKSGRLRQNRRKPSPPPSTLKTLEVDWDWRIGFGFTLPISDFLIRCFPHLENLIMFTRSTRCRLMELEVALMSQDMCEGYLDAAFPFKRNHEVIKVHKYIHKGQMYKSNIWELLPRLKVITHQWTVYTREGYEAYSRHGQRLVQGN